MRVMREKKKNHASIVFSDGVRWLARIPRTTSFSDVPPDLVDYLVESEYATLKYLESLSIPAPRAHGFGLASDVGNLVGVSYILEDAMPGSPFHAYEATTEQKSRVNEQYAQFLIRLSHSPVHKACSLSPSLHPPNKNTYEEGSIASTRFLTLSPHGPYTDAVDYYTSAVNLHMDLIADGQLYPSYPKEAYLFYGLLRDRAVPILVPTTIIPHENEYSTTTTTPPENDCFYLKHVDAKGDHILVDDEYNITAIIDWQFAPFVPATEAFDPSLFTADMGALYAGRASGLSDDDRLLATHLSRKGRDDLAALAAGGSDGNDLVRRFHFGLASGLTRDETLDMIGAVLFLLDGGKDQQLSRAEIEEWVEEQWLQAVADPRRDNIEELLKDLNEEKSKSV
ncbi:hypothetical protein F5Y17DRAFT_141186 [Xylariaceae sp. FL0594]|nr:hypothetical protein F5Y17DRAFT_141186 [Xylariaceae sp. FL0594]